MCFDRHPCLPPNRAGRRWWECPHWKTGILVVVLIMALGTAAPAKGETISGLDLEFGPRSVVLDVTIQNLQRAYKIDQTGNLQMLPFPEMTPVASRRVKVDFSPMGDRGRAVVRHDDDRWTLVLSRDNRVVEGAMLRTLPFGYRFLPPEGEARVGESWSQRFAAPPRGEGPRVEVTYEYTLTGSDPMRGCPDCISIEIRAVRRFIEDQKLMAAAADAHQTALTAFYLDERPFALGEVAFSPSEGFLHRLEILANWSMLTVLPVPGIARKIVIEREVNP